MFRETPAAAVSLAWLFAYMGVFSVSGDPSGRAQGIYARAVGAWSARPSAAVPAVELVGTTASGDPYNAIGRPDDVEQEDPVFRAGVRARFWPSGWAPACGLIHGPAGLGVLERRRSRRAPVRPGRCRRRRLRQRARRDELRVPPAVPADRARRRANATSSKRRPASTSNRTSTRSSRRMMPEGRPAPTTRQELVPGPRPRPLQAGAPRSAGARARRQGRGIQGQAPHHPSRQRRAATTDDMAVGFVEADLVAFGSLDLGEARDRRRRRQPQHRVEQRT